jgi:hypothetical protein
MYLSADIFFLKEKKRMISAHCELLTFQAATMPSQNHSSTDHFYLRSPPKPRLFHCISHNIKHQVLSTLTRHLPLNPHRTTKTDLRLQDASSSTYLTIACATLWHVFYSLMFFLGPSHILTLRLCPFLPTSAFLSPSPFLDRVQGTTSASPFSLA